MPEASSYHSTKHINCHRHWCNYINTARFNFHICLKSRNTHLVQTESFDQWILPTTLLQLFLPIRRNIDIVFTKQSFTLLITINTKMI